MPVGRLAGPSSSNTSASAATAAPSPADRATSSPKQRPVGRVAQREVLTTLTLGMVVGSRRTCRRQYNADKGSDRDSGYLLVAPARRSVAHRNRAFEAYEVG